MVPGDATALATELVAAKSAVVELAAWGQLTELPSASMTNHTEPMPWPFVSPGF